MTVSMPKAGDLLNHGSETHDGKPNICRVLETQDYPSHGFTAMFVNPDYPRHRRLGGDQPFFVWFGSPEHERMTTYEPNAQEEDRNNG